MTDQLTVGFEAIYNTCDCWLAAGFTHICNSPANKSGTIRRVEIYPFENITGLKVAIFAKESGNRFYTRDSASLGNAASGGKRTFTVSLEIEEGDYIGIYCDTGKISAGNDGTIGRWYLYGDYISIPSTTFDFKYGIDRISIYGYGTLATVTTTTPPSANDHESATLGGNVTDDGDEYITERGFEYKEGEEGEVSTVLEENADFGEGAYSLEITGLKPNVEYYYRAYAVNPSGTGYGDWESFTTDKTTPTVTVQAVTDILPTTATTNGNITCTGGEDCSERGFQYGLTKVATWTVSDIVGGYSAGAFSKGLTDLSANTTYWIRVYAVNTIGTGYSEWLEFQTAAAGIIPTGTKINICSDYSGYTYKLMRSETDDGEEYTAYFVISTDLTNKQGLAYYKRILDLELYFNKEDSGTATISVKKDNETTWEELGSVALTGDDDIIIKHLAVDVRAKHYLFKISASNHFEFLGALFQFISSGMR